LGVNEERANATEDKREDSCIFRELGVVASIDENVFAATVSMKVAKQAQLTFFSE
jgi:hypothetical protein